MLAALLLVAAPYKIDAIYLTRPGKQRDHWPGLPGTWHWASLDYDLTLQHYDIQKKQKQNCFLLSGDVNLD